MQYACFTKRTLPSSWSGFVNCSISIERTVLSGTFSRASSGVTTDWSGAARRPRAAARLVGRPELLDLERADRLERNLLEVLIGDDDVLVRRVLVALHGLRATDDLLVRRAPDLHVDPGQIGLVEHVEADAVLRLGREVQLDRDGHQTEL